MLKGMERIYFPVEIIIAYQSGEVGALQVGTRVSIEGTSTVPQTMQSAVHLSEAPQQTWRTGTICIEVLPLILPKPLTGGTKVLDPWDEPRPSTPDRFQVTAVDNYKLCYCHLKHKYKYILCNPTQYFCLLVCWSICFLLWFINLSLCQVWLEWSGH